MHEQAHDMRNYLSCIFHQDNDARWFYLESQIAEYAEGTKMLKIITRVI